MDSSFDWRRALQEWLKINSEIAPSELRELHQQFLQHFPREKIATWTLEQYAMAHEASFDSYCYWLDYKTKSLASVKGGSIAKWGVWWNKFKNDWSYNSRWESAHQALHDIKHGLISLLDAVESGKYGALDKLGDELLGPNRNSLRAKSLYLYFPNEFLPISNPAHLANILTFFGQKPVRGLHARNRQLLQFLRGLPEFNGFDTLQMMRFLYAHGLQQGAFVFQNRAALEAAIEAFVRFANSPLYHTHEYNYKRNLLEALQEPLLQIVEGESTTAVHALHNVWATYQKDATNLTSWQDYDNFAQYLTGVPSERVQEELQALLDTDGDLVERIDTFRVAAEADYQNYLEKKARPSLALISLILMAHSPSENIIYRASVIDQASRDWNAPSVTGGFYNDGVKYSQYLSLVLPLQKELTKALDRAADLIDMHTLLWFNSSKEYDEFKDGKGKDSKKETLRAFLQHPELEQVITRTRNIIFYGPPGTGKTYWANQFA